MLEGSTQPARSIPRSFMPPCGPQRCDTIAVPHVGRVARPAQRSAILFPIATAYSHRFRALSKWLIVADLEAAPYTNLSTASTEGSRNERSPSRRDGGPRVGRRQGKAGDHQARDLHLRKTRPARTATAPGHHRPAPSHGARSAPSEDAEQADAVRLLQAAVRARRTHAAERTACAEERLR